MTALGTYHTAQSDCTAEGDFAWGRVYVVLGESVNLGAAGRNDAAPIDLCGNTTQTSVKRIRVRNISDHSDADERFYFRFRRRRRRVRVLETTSGRQVSEVAKPRTGCVQFSPQSTVLATWEPYMGEVTWEQYMGEVTWEPYMGEVTWEQYMGEVTWEPYMGEVTWELHMGEVTWELHMGDITWELYMGEVTQEPYMGDVT